MLVRWGKNCLGQSSHLSWTKDLYLPKASKDGNETDDWDWVNMAWRMGAMDLSDEGRNRVRVIRAGLVSSVTGVRGEWCVNCCHYNRPGYSPQGCLMYSSAHLRHQHEHLWRTTGLPGLSPSFFAIFLGRWGTAGICRRGGVPTTSSGWLCLPPSTSVGTQMLYSKYRPLKVWDLPMFENWIWWFKLSKSKSVTSK